MRERVYRSLLLLAAFVPALVVTAGIVPGLCQDEGDGQSCALCQNCTVCKVGSQPTLAATASMTAALPPLLASSAHAASQGDELQVAHPESSPRAPPA